ncbi:MAG: acyl-ACP--UDP-N-acetylglucosamine O-acyltransferase [Candidatus Binataceae bacterium]
MAGRIHPAAAIDRSAEIDSTVQIGPGAVVGPNVKIGPDTWVGPCAVIARNTTIGARNKIFQFASVGEDSQDLKYKGEPSRLEIGDECRIREFASIHRGTEGGGMLTRIGNRVLVMNYAHIAHNCKVGDDVIITNSAQLGGHCIVDEFANIEGMAGLHQFCHVGAHAFVAAGAKVAQDVPPYSMVAGAERARLVAINEIGLQRRGFKPETINALKSALRTIFYSKLLREDALKKVLDDQGDIPEVRRLVDFIANSQRGVVGRERE